MRSLGLLLAGLLCLAMPEALMAQSRECPPGMSGQAGHWHSPVEDNLADKAPDQCATCAESVNQAHPSCVVHRVLQSEDCRDGRCSTEEGDFAVNWEDGYAVQQSLRFQSPFKFILDAGNNCWFLVWALDPVIGVEHAGVRDRVNYWYAGYQAATNMVSPAIAESELAMLIQPAHRRSQHQLHIHIGRIQPSYRRAIDELPLNPGSVFNLSIGGHDFVASYLPDLLARKPLEGHRVFERVSSMLPGGESSMPLYGVMVARDKGQSGSWLLAAQGLTRRQLVLSQDRACELKP